MKDFKIIFNKVYNKDEHIATINFKKLYVKKDKACASSSKYINKISLKLKLDIEYY